MKKRLKTLAVALLVSSQVSLAQKTGSYKPHTVHAQGSGCVRPAKEEGCFVLHDIKAHRYYDVSFGASKPEPYTAIWFEGIGYHHDAHCKQGQPVHVSHWKPLPGKCSQPDSSQSKSK